jgi:cold shock CspA family protein
MADEATKLTGTVKFWKSDRGFGFITYGAYGDEIFAHISQVDEQCDDPQKGDQVEFIKDVGRDGRPYARQIVVKAV